MDFSLWRPLGMRYGQLKKTKMSDFRSFIDWFLNFWNRFMFDQNFKINLFWAVLGLFGPFFAHKMANNGPISKIFNFFEVLDIPAQNGSNNFFSNCRVTDRLILLANRFLKNDTETVGYWIMYMLIVNSISPHHGTKYPQVKLSDFVTRQTLSSEQLRLSYTRLFVELYVVLFDEQKFELYFCYVVTQRHAITGVSSTNSMFHYTSVRRTAHSST